VRIEGKAGPEVDVKLKDEPETALPRVAEHVPSVVPVYVQSIVCSMVVASPSTLGAPLKKTVTPPDFV